MKNPEINQFNLNSGLLAKHKATIYSNATWHKIEVENAVNLERDTVLRTLMNFVHPLDFIPVCYENKGTYISFLLKNCGAAIERLCRHNLIVANPQDPSMPFKIKIILKFAYAADLKINIQNNILSILTKRYHAETGVLNLDMFYKDPDLIEFCTLSQPKLMFYVLHLSRSENRPKQPKSIKLSNNEIEVLKPLEALFGLKSLTSLDLRNNRIKDIDAGNFKDLNITELWLDGNPICDDYDEYSYPRAMREIIPTLEKLDGVFIKNKGMLPFRRNFLCSSSGHDLVDQFMEHYFNFYDTKNRNYLEGVYHKDAMFSMSAHYLGMQSTSLTAKLSPYKKITRNLKMMSDFSKNDECLFRGRDTIIRLLMQLPLTEHDPNTFTVDLMSYTETAAVLVIAGVFREVPENLLDADRILGFSRVFVLHAGSNNEYSIVNEQLHVYNATSAQVMRSFKQAKISRPSHIQISLPKNVKEQVMLAEALVSLTGLDIEWATKCLEECQFDFKKSLELFVDLFKLDKIPAHAFRNLSAENVQSKNPEPLVENPYLKSVCTTPETILEQQPILPPVKIPKININEFDINSYKKKELNRKQRESVDSFESLEDDVEIIDDKVEIIDLSDDEEDIMKDSVKYRRFLPLPPNAKVSPYGIIENYEPFLYPEPKDREKKKSRKRMTHPSVKQLQTAREMAGFMERYKSLQSRCVIDNLNFYKDCIPFAMEILQSYSYHIVTYELLLIWYYPRQRVAARELCSKIMAYVQANPNICISLRILKVLIAECECRGYDVENKFKRIIIEYPNHLEAIKCCIRILCTYISYKKVKALQRIRDFFNWLLPVISNPCAVIEIIKEHEKAYSIKIL